MENLITKEDFKQNLDQIQLKLVKKEELFPIQEQV